MVNLSAMQDAATKMAKSNRTASVKNGTDQRNIHSTGSV